MFPIFGGSVAQPIPAVRSRGLPPPQPESSPPAVTKKLFSEIASKFVDRASGYTRIISEGNRVGDRANVAILELVASPGRIEVNSGTSSVADTRVGEFCSSYANWSCLRILEQRSNNNRFLIHVPHIQNFIPVIIANNQ